MDIQARIDEWIRESGATLDGAQSNRLFRMVEKLSDDAYADGEEQGLEDGKASVMRDAEEIAEQAIDEFKDEIETALSLIDTDREAAKVYLDRAYNGLSFTLPKKEAAPCLL